MKNEEKKEEDTSVPEPCKDQSLLQNLDPEPVTSEINKVFSVDNSPRNSETKMEECAEEDNYADLVNKSPDSKSLMAEEEETRETVVANSETELDKNTIKTIEETEEYTNTNDEKIIENNSDIIEDTEIIEDGESKPLCDVLTEINNEIKMKENNDDKKEFKK